MITCHLKYIIDSTKLDEFEQYCRMWLPLLKKFGGVHHGYLLPSEGASNVAMGSFSFESLAAYEQYRSRSLDDPECQLAFKFAKDTRCFLSYERTFFHIEGSPRFQCNYWRYANPALARGWCW